jgi:hypothetical protein
MPDDGVDVSLASADPLAIGTPQAIGINTEPPLTTNDSPTDPLNTDGATEPALVTEPSIGIPELDALGSMATHTDSETNEITIDISLADGILTTPDDLTQIENIILAEMALAKEVSATLTVDALQNPDGQWDVAVDIDPVTGTTIDINLADNFQSILAAPAGVLAPSMQFKFMPLNPDDSALITDASLSDASSTALDTTNESTLFVEPISWSNLALYTGVETLYKDVAITDNLSETQLETNTEDLDANLGATPNQANDATIIDKNIVIDSSIPMDDFMFPEIAVCDMPLPVWLGEEPSIPTDLAADQVVAIEPTTQDVAVTLDVADETVIDMNPLGETTLTNVISDDSMPMDDFMFPEIAVCDMPLPVWLGEEPSIPTDLAADQVVTIEPTTQDVAVTLDVADETVIDAGLSGELTIAGGISVDDLIIPTSDMWLCYLPAPEPLLMAEFEMPVYSGDVVGSMIESDLSAVPDTATDGNVSIVENAEILSNLIIFEFPSDMCFLPAVDALYLPELALPILIDEANTDSESVGYIGLNPIPA